MPEEILDLSFPTLSPARGSLASRFPANAHICHFYRSQTELLELMIPYFLEGLALGEFCLWGVAEPMTVPSASAALDAALKGCFADVVGKGQIEIFDIAKLYGKGAFDAMAVKDAFMRKVLETRNRGWDGFRCDGMVSGVSPRQWRNYQTYELEVTRHLRENTTALCSYDATRLSAEEAVEVVTAHHASIIKRDGRWFTMRTPRA